MSADTALAFCPECGCIGQFPAALICQECGGEVEPAAVIPLVELNALRAKVAETEKPIHQIKMTLKDDTKFVIDLVAALADMYKFDGADDDIVARVHGWHGNCASVVITLGHLRAAKRVQQAEKQDGGER